VTETEIQMAENAHADEQAEALLATAKSYAVVPPQLAAMLSAAREMRDAKEAARIAEIDSANRIREASLALAVARDIHPALFPYQKGMPRIAMHRGERYADAEFAIPGLQHHIFVRFEWNGTDWSPRKSEEGDKDTIYCVGGHNIWSLGEALLLAEGVEKPSPDDMPF
jgi:hypothetical protein